MNGVKVRWRFAELLYWHYCGYDMYGDLDMEYFGVENMSLNQVRSGERRSADVITGLIILKKRWKIGMAFCHNVDAAIIVVIFKAVNFML